jgi:hypothetical protein
MKIIKNEKLIKRNGKWGEYLSLAGLLVMGAGIFLASQFLLKPQQAVTTLNNLIFLGLMAVGIVLSQVSSTIGKRYGRSPRPDEKLDAALKGLPGETTLYHFMTPASHLLVGPAGLWVLIPSSAVGKAYYSKKRWRNSGGGFFQGYLRLFGQEGIGSPDLDAEAESAALQKKLAKKMDADQVPPISAVLVFTEASVDLDAGDSPLPTVRLKQLKDFFRQKIKEKALSDEQVEKIKSALE